MTLFNRNFIYATSFLGLTVCSNLSAQEPSAYVPIVDSKPMYSLDLASQYLFRGILLSDSSISASMSVDQALTERTFIGASLRLTPSASNAELVTEAHAVQIFPLWFADIGLSAEYINWHHSTYNPMASMGVSIIKDGFRILYKKDLAALGGNHFQIDYQVLNQGSWTASASVLDTVAPTDWYLYSVVEEDPNDATATITRNYIREDSLNLKMLSLQAKYTYSPQLKFYGTFYFHLEDPSSVRQLPINIPDIDTSIWVFGLRWSIN